MKRIVFVPILALLAITALIGVSAGTGVAEEQNYSVASLDASQPGSTSIWKFKRHDQKIALNPCRAGNITVQCHDSDACCAFLGQPYCCSGSCGTGGKCCPKGKDC